MARATRPEGNLPVPLTRFVGRRTEIAQVRRALQETRLVTLTGVGGVGKTRLALEVARAVERAFPGGAWMVDLSAVVDPGQVPQAVATALGVVDRSTRPPADTIADRLADREALLVLDNCEHVIDGCAPFVDGLLGRAPRVRVLATSRRTLAVPGEHLFPVPPLGVPDEPGTDSTETVGRFDAVQLLVDRARALQPGFALTEANRVAVARLCARLDGLPLAIELAATRLRTLSPDQLLDRLEGRFALLTGGSRSAGGRRQTLRAVMDWSHSLCSPAERLLWARLSVFTGGFDLDAAESVCADADLPRDDVLDLLDRLVAQSIVLPGAADHGMRFRLLETIRQYGRERLVDLGQESALLRRHRDHYLGVARWAAAQWCTPRQQQALARLRTEHGNLRAALEAAVADPDGPRAALALSAALRHHWYADAFLAEGRRWLDQALALPGPPPVPPERVDALWVSAWVCLLQGDLAPARDRLAECARLAGRTGDRRALGYVRSLTGTAELFQGHLSAALTAFEDGLAVFDAVDDGEGALWTMFQLAITLAHSGSGERAREVCRQALERSAATGERLCRSYTLWVLGFETWLAGDPVTAAGHARDGLLLQRDFNDPVGLALIIELLAWVRASREGSRPDLLAAARLLGTADAVWDLIGTRLSAFGPPLGVHREACERRLRTGLDDATATQARLRGRQPSVAAAITAALDLTGPATGTATAAGMTAPTGPTTVTGAGGAAGRTGTGTAGGTGTGAAPPVAPLTPREAEVASLLAEGLSNRAIAGRLVISQRTVDGHVERILAKLGFTARTQVAAWVATRGTAGADPR